MPTYSTKLSKKCVKKPNGHAKGFDKTVHCMQIMEGATTVEKVMKLFDVKKKTVLSWLYKLRKGFALHDGPGQPPAISDNQLQKVVEIATSATFDLTTEEFEEKLNAAKSATEDDYNKVVKSIHGISRKTMKKYVAKAELKETYAEIATSSRALATTDVYNFVSFAAMNKYMVVTKAINQLLILNADATQFEVGGKTDHRVKILRARSTTKGKHGPKAQQKKGNSDGSTSYFIKYYLLISAGGIQADPIFIIADENMGAEEFRVVTVPGLGVGTNLNNVGHVVFCKTRTGNTQFFKWFIEFCLVPFVLSIKTHYELNDEAESWFQLDGEDVQLKAFQCPKMLGLLEGARIHVGKPPGSTSAVTQPCDKGNCFRGPKTQARRFNNGHVKDNVFMLKKLKTIFDDHSKWLNDEQRGHLRDVGKKKKRPNKKDKPGTIEFNPAHAKYAKFGLLRVQLALQYCMRPHMIRASFVDCGIFPFNPAVIMKNCRATIAPDDLRKIIANVDHLVDLFRLNGELSEFDLEILGISSQVDRRGKKPLDQVILNRRRSCIVTHPRVLAREKIAYPPPPPPPQVHSRPKREAANPINIAKRLRNL